jgi:hypothetical protein
MSGRSRTRTLSVGVGNAVNGTSSWSGEVFAHSTCDDVTDGPDGPLLIEHEFEYSNLFLSYQSPDGKLRLKNWFPAAAQSRAMSSVTIPGIPTIGALNAQIIAKTNPSRPMIRLPVSFLELREIPSLFRDYGANLIKRSSGQHLAREFGWQPLIKDLWVLANLTEAVDNRLELFKKLQDGPMCRKVRLASNAGTNSAGSSFAANSSPTWLFANYRIELAVRKQQIWGYAKWAPTSAFKDIRTYDNTELRKRARSAILGLNISPAAAWNAIPWTWLIDWFANFGDILASYESVVPVHWTAAAECRKTSYQEVWRMTGNNWGMPPDHVFTRGSWIKRRTPFSILTPGASLPLLTEGQVKILSSLIAQRLS